MSDIKKLAFSRSHCFRQLGFNSRTHSAKTNTKSDKDILIPNIFLEDSLCFPTFCPNEYFCRNCASFSQEKVYGVKLNRIVKTPSQKDDHLTGINGYLTEHLSKQFHENNLSRANEFVESNAEGVEQQGNIGAAKKRKKMAFMQIVSSIEVFKRKGFALLGQRDFGALLMPQSNWTKIFDQHCS